MYLVSLIGTNVFHDNTAVCVMDRMSELDTKVRPYIKSHFNVEFEELSCSFTSDWWKFRNTTDNRDITLVVEHIDRADVLIA